MSGPKGYAYTVAAEEVARQRSVADARAQCAALHEQVRAAAAEAATFGDALIRVNQPARIADDATAEQARDAVAASELHLRAVLARRERARADAVARSFASHVPAAVQGQIDLTWNANGADVTDAAARSGAEDETSDETTQRVLARVLAALAYVHDVTERERLLARATVLSAEQASSARLRALSVEVHSKLREERQRAALASDASSAALTLAGITSRAADTARAALAAVHDRQSLTAAVTLAAAARDEHRAALDRQFVVEQTIEALAELGYEVDAAFQTTALTGGFAVAPKVGLDSHALQLRFDPQSSNVLTNTVALREDTAPVEDTRAEVETCADIDAVRVHLGRGGITLHQFHSVAPGAVAVERRTDHATQTAAERTRRRAANQANATKPREAGR